jgi:aerobic-type carbon monoxide dehydrogenase small subunit (CoxS/CutS family)
VRGHDRGIGLAPPFSRAYTLHGKRNATMRAEFPEETRMLAAQAQVLPIAPEDTIVPNKVRAAIDVLINGEHFRHTGDPKLPLLWYLRDVLRLTGTKIAGEQASTGADLVLLAGKPVPAASVSIEQLAGREVLTVEGLAANDGTLHPLQQAFIDEDAIGCGYCTPGWLISGVALLQRKPQPTDDDIDQLPNVCRCGCQTRVRRAIKRAAAGKANVA